jgi:hypothetical protein
MRGLLSFIGIVLFLMMVSCILLLALSTTAATH